MCEWDEAIQRMIDWIENNLTEETTPIEAGLTWSVSKNKTADYNGKKKIVEQLKNGVEKKLFGLMMKDKSIPRHEYEVFYNNQKIELYSGGKVTNMFWVKVSHLHI